MCSVGCLKSRKETKNKKARTRKFADISLQKSVTMALLSAFQNGCCKSEMEKMGENKERLRKKEKMRVWGAILTRLKKTQNAILNWFFSNMKANDCVQRYPKSF